MFVKKKKKDQDQDLDDLSDAIRRQRELGLLIGDELESHAILIDETEEMVDRTDERLRKAKKKLDHVGRKVKDNSKPSKKKKKKPFIIAHVLYRICLYCHCFDFNIFYFGCIVKITSNKSCMAIVYFCFLMGK